MTKKQQIKEFRKSIKGYEKLVGEPIEAGLYSWLEFFLSKALAIAEDRGRQEVLNWIDDNKQTITDELGRSSIIYVVDIKGHFYLKKLKGGI